MSLVCPSCGSDEIAEAGLDEGGYGSLDQRYSCKRCGYFGPLAIESGEESAPSERRDFPYTIALLIAFMSVAAYGLGASLTASALFFIILSAALVLSYHFLGGNDEEAVEEDLKELGEDGEPRR